MSSVNNVNSCFLVLNTSHKKRKIPRDLPEAKRKALPAIILQMKASRVSETTSLPARAVPPQSEAIRNELRGVAGIHQISQKLLLDAKVARTSRNREAIRKVINETDHFIKNYETYLNSYVLCKHNYCCLQMEFDLFQLDSSMKHRSALIRRINSIGNFVLTALFRQNIDASKADFILNNLMIPATSVAHQNAVLKFRQKLEGVYKVLIAAF